MRLRDYPPLESWLKQFGRDEPTAAKLVERVRYVSAERFTAEMRELLLTRIPGGARCALFIERELQTTRSGRPAKMYVEERLVRGRGLPRRLRAKGSARQVVRSPRSDRQEVGSEGVVATFATQLAREYPAQFIVQPSAEQLRHFKPRHFVILSDLVASGNRVARFLSSLWQVKTIKSWSSGRQVRFDVFAYAATNEGSRAIQRHRCRARLETVVQCPTVWSEFTGTLRDEIVELCERYGERLKKEPLGYGRIAALLAFAHGCPNNAPAVFHRRSTLMRRPWEPLFPGRVTALVSRHTVERATDSITMAMESLGESGLLKAEGFVNATTEQKQVLLLLAATRHGHRSLRRLPLVTDLRLWELANAISKAEAAGLLDTNRRLTPPGLALLRQLRQQSACDKSPIRTGAKGEYYPQSLRAPLDGH
jgi:hypothetical protein